MYACFHYFERNEHIHHMSKIMLVGAACEVQTIEESGAADVVDFLYSFVRER